MKKAYRVGVRRFLSDSELKKHIAVISDNVDVIDEITLFLEISHHGYYKLDVIKEICDTVKRRIPEYRKAGVKSVGINTLCTIGHLDECWDILPPVPFGTIVGPDGKISKSCMCPNSSDYLEYISEKYRIMAEAYPDYIKVNDDIPLDNHAVVKSEHGKKKKKCISDFNKSYGHNLSREELCRQLELSPEIYRQWDEFHIGIYENLGLAVEKAVHSVNEKIEIGLMIGSPLSKFEKAFGAVRVRPGGSFYTDDTPIEALIKAHRCGPQISDCIPEVQSDIQYEFENFPYQQLGKSNTLSRAECSLALMIGCNGIAYNTMMRYDFPAIYPLVRENSAYWDEMERKCRGKYNTGLNFFDLFVASDFNLLGVPVSYDKNAPASVLSGDYAKHLTDSEIRKLLSGGLLLDRQAFMILCDRGFSEYTGCRIKEDFTNSMTEFFTDDPINRTVEGFIRDPFMNFKGDRTVSSLELGDGCRCVATLKTVLGEDKGCCLSAFENSLGGRVAVSTYLPFEMLRYSQKRIQLLNLADWLCKGTDIRINADKKIAPFVRKGADGSIAVMLFNCDFDPTGEFTVTLRCDRTSGTVKLLRYDGSYQDLKTEKVSDGIEITVPDITPWHEAFITVSAE